MGEIIDIGRGIKTTDIEVKDTNLGDEIKKKWEFEGRIEYRNVFGNLIPTLQTSREIRISEDSFVTGYIAGKAKMCKELIKDAVDKIRAETNNSKADSAHSTPSE